MPVNYYKVATIVKKIKTLRGTLIEIPKSDEVDNVFGLQNTDDTDPARPLSRTIPRDIGPHNAQTVSGTGKGAPIAPHSKDEGFNESYCTQAGATPSAPRTKKNPCCD